MGELHSLIKDLALILMVAGIVTLVFKRLKQPLVLGYVVAGFLVSPHMPYVASVVDQADIHTWADIGVMFLLFSLGLDFSFKKILKMGASPIISTVTIIFCMMMLGIVMGHLFGWGKMDCIFLGGMLAMSSTTIIYKAFDDLGLRQQQFAGRVMSVLILETDAGCGHQNHLLPDSVVRGGYLCYSAVPAQDAEADEQRGAVDRVVRTLLCHGRILHEGGVQQCFRGLRHG